MEQIRKYRPEDRDQLESLVYGELGLGKGEMTFLTEKCDELIICENGDELLGFGFYRPLENYEKTGNVYNDGIFMILGIAVLAFMLICILLYKFNIVRYILIALIAVFAVIFRKKLIYAFKKALNK